jgi:hypothetical protein
MRLPLLILSLPLLAAGCSAKDAVSLSVRLSQAEVDVSMGTFGSSVSGSVVVELTLGPEASGPTTVNVDNLSLETQSGEALVPVLSLSGAGFPLVVGKGETKSVTLTIAAPMVDYAKACAGQVQVRGSFSDTLKGATDSAVSDPIVPGCGSTT